MRYKSVLFTNAQIVVGATQAITQYLPKGILRRVECYVVSEGTVYPDTATGFLDEVFLQDITNISSALHLLSQEPLSGRAVVAWTDKFFTGNNNFAVTAWFADLTVGAKIEMNVQMDVEE